MTGRPSLSLRRVFVEVRLPFGGHDGRLRTGCESLRRMRAAGELSPHARNVMVQAGARRHFRSLRARG